MPTQPALQYERELRLAVVMYGGVSLAIYMNGATQELLQFVRATAPAPAAPFPVRARYSNEELDGSSAAVYRQLARLATSDVGQGGAPDDPQAPLRMRFVIDILSGTSAGGINSVFLAKALANGQPIDGLARLWQTEADLGLLINDAESRSGVPKLPRNSPPRSLLNGQRMFRELLQAFDEMDGDDDRATPAASLVGEVDLFVTATDLEGLPIRLQLGGGEVAEERQYRKSFHLAFGGGRNDFTREDNPFLAFISRCTSSLPVAFEPMQFKGAADLLRVLRRPLQTEEIPRRWQRHFAEYDASGTSRMARETRSFADGGYLDNKPFSYAIDAIAARRGGDSGRVERKLVYIEPDPERLSPGDSDDGGAEPPNALDNAVAVVQLRSYETIREELLRLRDRNRLVDKIRSVVAGVDDDFESLGDQARSQLARIIASRDTFGQRALDEVVKVFGSAYGGYHRLKVGQLTDELSQAVACHAGLSLASDEFRMIRLLVRAWRNCRYAPNPQAADRRSEFNFLTAFDLSYRIRRAGFVIDQLNRFLVLTPDELAANLRVHRSICGGPTALAIAAEIPGLLAQAFVERRAQLVGIRSALAAARDILLAPEPDGRLSAIVAHAGEIRAKAAELMALATDRQRRERVDHLVGDQSDGAVDRMLSDMQAAIEAVVRQAVDRARTDCEALLKTDSRPQLTSSVPETPDEVVNYIARHYYTWYELYDSMVFPIVHGTEIGDEIAPVESVRISPLTKREADGLWIGRRNLMPSGLAVGHFGAFLSQQWRARDILIGRMNAAEKLIRTALSGTPHDKPDVIQMFVQRAHTAILEEECGRTGSTIGKQLASVHNAASPAARLAYVEREGLPQEPLPSERMASWIARSAQVLGRVFRDASEQQPASKKAATLLLYAGHVLAGMVEVVVPRKWWATVLRLWIPRLLLFSIALVMVGPLLGKEQVTSLGWTLLILVSAFGALTLVLRSWIQTSWSATTRFLTSLAALALTVLLWIGVVYAPAAWRSTWDWLRLFWW